MMMKMSKCDQACIAKVTVSGDEEFVLTLFSSMISKIIEGIERLSISLRLLAAPEHSFSVGNIGNNNIVYAVKKFTQNMHNYYTLLDYNTYNLILHFTPFLI